MGQPASSVRPIFDALVEALNASDASNSAPSWVHADGPDSAPIAVTPLIEQAASDDVSHALASDGGSSINSTFGPLVDALNVADASYSAPAWDHADGLAGSAIDTAPMIDQSAGDGFGHVLSSDDGIWLNDATSTNGPLTGEGSPNSATDGIASSAGESTNNFVPTADSAALGANLSSVHNCAPGIFDTDLGAHLGQADEANITDGPTSVISSASSASVFTASSQNFDNPPPAIPSSPEPDTTSHTTPSIAPVRGAAFGP